MIEFLSSGYGLFGMLFSFLLFVSAQTSLIFSDYWLITWSSSESEYKNQTSLNSTSNFTLLPQEISKQREHKLMIYSIVVGLAVILGMIRSVFFFVDCIKTANKYHKNMLKHVMLAPMNFFNVNPIGRIINRFSKDISSVDDYLVWGLFELFLVI